MTTATYKNSTHRTDEALTAWVPTGKGTARVYSNYEGWTISKSQGGWIITRPNGFRADRLVKPSLFEAKCAVVRYMEQGVS